MMGGMNIVFPSHVSKRVSMGSFPSGFGPERLDRTPRRVVVEYPNRQSAGVPGKAVEVGAVREQQRMLSALVVTVDHMLARTVRCVIDQTGTLVLDRHVVAVQ